MQTQLIPAYVYQEYADDVDIQAFNTAFNQLAQQYITTFATLGLPVYTGLTGLLLDWVGTGLYGFPRPTLTNGSPTPAKLGGMLGFNKLGVRKLGQFVKSQPASPASIYYTSDDVYQRILTWRFYKGDGFMFSIPWLKRRIARFLNGTNGTAPNIDQTNIISVTINNSDIVTISFLAGNVTKILSGQLGTFELGKAQLGGFVSTSQKYPANQYIKYFASAVQGGVLDLPFQFVFKVVT